MSKPPPIDSKKFVDLVTLVGDALEIGVHCIDHHNDLNRCLPPIDRLERR